MSPVVFYAAAFLTVFCVVAMILQKNPVASAIFLVLSFFGLAVVYVTLEAHFVAALQILVYAGAIMVLFIFVIMLLNLKDDELVADHVTVGRVAAGAAGLGLFAFLAHYIFKIPTRAFPELAPGFGTAEEAAKLMLTDYVVPFEVIGVLLLAGLVGAVVLGRREN